MKVLKYIFLVFLSINSLQFLIAQEDADPSDALKKYLVECSNATATTMKPVYAGKSASGNPYNINAIKYKKSWLIIVTDSSHFDTYLWSAEEGALTPYSAFMNSNVGKIIQAKYLKFKKKKNDIQVGELNFRNYYVFNKHGKKFYKHSKSIEDGKPKYCFLGWLVAPLSNLVKSKLPGDVAPPASPCQSLEQKVAELEARMKQRDEEIANLQKATETIKNDKEKPKDNTNVNNPKDSTNVNNPKDNTNVNNPKDSTNVNNPKDSTNVNNPKDSTNVNNPKDSTNVNNPKDSTNVNNPKDNTNVNNPKDSLTIQIRELLEGVEERIRSVKNNNNISNSEKKKLLSDLEKKRQTLNAQLNGTDNNTSDNINLDIDKIKKLNKKEAEKTLDIVKKRIKSIEKSNLSRSEKEKLLAYLEERKQILSTKLKEEN